MSKRLADDALYFLPLGGVNEIGMNLNLYGYNDQWLMVDLGTSFADDTAPGVEMIVPDVTWIAERKDKLLGLVLTHAHEDHLGAISHCWHELGCQIWATGFAASVLRRKLEEKGIEELVTINIYEPGERIDRSRTVTFTFDGKPVAANARDGIAVVDERRRADRADLQARLRGEKPKDSS